MIMDMIGFEKALSLAEPRRVARVLKQHRHDSYAARASIRGAIHRADPKWIEAFTAEARRIGLDLQFLNDP